jgi:ATP-dependent Clp protease ATP-binding subunit ClpA
MDYGRLTDNNGRCADFRHVIVVMTTNAGAELLEKPSVGFVEQDRRHDSFESIKRLFSPEFRNRLDAVIQFNHLDTKTLFRVVDKFIMELEVQLQDKHVALDVDASARNWLALRGYDPAMGARPMARVIQEKIKTPLADELLFGRLTNGGMVKISEKDGDLHFELSQIVPGGIIRSHPQ